MAKIMIITTTMQSKPIAKKRGLRLSASYRCPPAKSKIPMPIEPIVAEVERKTPRLKVQFTILFASRAVFAANAKGFTINVPMNPIVIYGL